MCHRHTSNISRQWSHNIYYTHACHQNYIPLKWRLLERWQIRQDTIVDGYRYYIRWAMSQWAMTTNLTLTLSLTILTLTLKIRNTRVVLLITGVRVCVTAVISVVRVRTTALAWPYNSIQLRKGLRYRINILTSETGKRLFDLVQTCLPQAMANCTYKIVLNVYVI